ncbi:phosphoribosylglycinamide formyltransferase [Pacificimonas sp. WHA3]|uniref:Phosphoribosylglycinamide formyltransferase n=1 Tax=Pacificimonas pallii TaxID=2827236 RepID=A0ABS6SGM7_9SPHN|nr:phosphoribosylglycinamide formyltransferase [Pacificimonas pallii]MBV7257041.1 phosphoribosylglycinamide formyltransferase [Pacificimonas pallii]
MPEKARVAILISGTGTNMAALLYAAKADDCPYEVVLVASNNPDAPGLRLADAENIPTWAKSHKGMDRAAFDTEIGAAIEDAQAGYVALAGYMRLLSPEFVARWQHRMLNIHPSLLPKYKGLDTCQRALDAGDSHAGCSVHLVTAEVDDGEVLAQTKVAITDGDTAETLARRVQFAEHQLFPRTLARWVTRYHAPDWLLSEVTKYALALPETEARDTHGSPGFRCIKGKYFAIFSQNHHGDERVALLVKTSGQDEMNTLIEADPETYHRPAYYGASGWVGVRLDTGEPDWDLVETWLRKSWRAVAPKRLTKLMDAADEF